MKRYSIQIILLLDKYLENILLFISDFSFLITKTCPHKSRISHSQIQFAFFQIQYVFCIGFS